eukprot:6206915-Pleurochrysis_carterae.AAC.2
MITPNVNLQYTCLPSCPFLYLQHELATNLVTKPAKKSFYCARSAETESYHRTLGSSPPVFAWCLSWLPLPCFGLGSVQLYSFATVIRELIFACSSDITRGDLARASYAHLPWFSSHRSASTPTSCTWVAARLEVRHLNLSSS